MSFSSGGGGFGGMQETLAYMIKAFDMATPVFRAFGAEVEAVTKNVQRNLAEMNRSMVAQQKLIEDGAVKQQAALGKTKAAQVGAADASMASARKQSEASKLSAAGSQEQAVAARRAADVQIRAAAESAAAFGRSGSSLTRFGRDVALGTLAAGAGFLDLQGKFQANTLRMETQAGATARGLDQIRQGLLKMAGQVGATPDQLANGMYHVVSSMNAVLPAATRVAQELKIMKIAAEGAQVGHSNLEETTYALGSAMNALHLQANSASRVMGQLNAIVGSGDMTMQDLVLAFKSGIIPAAKEFGISLQSVGAALAVMGDMGMRGALAGTRLRMAISLLAAPTQQAAKILETLGMSTHQALATTERMSALLKKAGISVTTLSNDLRKPDGLAVALADLNNHLKSNGLSADAAGAAVDRAFGGGRMGATIKLLAENTDRLGLKFDQIGKATGQFGHDWQLTSQTFRIEVDKALAAVEAFGVGIGEKMLPYATSALRDIEDLANWFAKNKTALDLLGISVVSFASIAVGSYFVSKIRGAVQLMKDFGSGIQGAGRWLLGASGGGVAGAGGMGAPTLGGSGALMGGLWGVNATQIRVGTLMNPIAVTMAGAGLAGGARNATEAAAQRAAGIGPATVAGESQVARDLKAGGTSLDARIAAMEAAQRTPTVGFSGAGVVRDPATGRFMTVPTVPATGMAPSATAAERMGRINPITGQLESSAAVRMGTINPATGGLMAIPGGRPVIPAERQAADLKGTLKEGFGTLMRGGAIAGMGIMASQLAGQVIGGSPGRTVAHVGTGASIGAGAGMLATMIPGVGPIVGPLVGAIGGGLVAGLIDLFHHKSYGQKIADSLTAGFGGSAADDLKKQLSSALDDAHKQLQGHVTRTGVHDAELHVPITLDPSQLSPAKLDKYNADMQRAGKLVARQLETGWSQYKFQSEPVLLQQFRTETKKLPPIAQEQALQSVVAFSKQMEASGKLTKGSTKQLIGDIEGQFPSLTNYMGLSAAASVDTFTKKLKFDQARNNTKTTMGSIANDFSVVRLAMDWTAGGVDQKAGAMVASLQNIVRTGTGPMRKQAKADLAALLASFNQDFSAAASVADSKMASLKSAVALGSQQAVQNAGQYWGQFAGIVHDAVKAGAISVKQGNKIIADELGKALQALGVPAKDAAKLATAGYTVQEVAGIMAGGAYLPPIIQAPKHATGAVVRTPTYMVGEEGAAHPEYVLATNPAYRQRNLGLWAAAARDLGVPGFATGGYVFPFPKGEKFGWQRIDQGQDLQGPPGGPVLAVGPGMVSIGHDRFGGFGPSYPVEQMSAGPWAGRGIYYGHAKDIRTGLVTAGTPIGVTQSVANQWTAAPAGWLELGFTSALGGGVHGQGAAVAPMLHALASGHMVAGMAGGLAQIRTPKVTGDGAIAALVRGVLKQITAAANLSLGSLSGGLPGGLPSSGGGNAAANRALARSMLGAFGWGLDQWPALNALWTGESGFNQFARNASSGAFGIPQALPGSKMASAGSDWMTNPATQEKWGEGYIKSVYGSPSAAYAAWLSRSPHWYASGGRIPSYAGAFAQGGAFTTTGPTLGLFGEGGIPETVFAVPHFQTGGTPPKVTQSTSTNAAGETTTSTTVTTTTVVGGEKVTTSHRTSHGPTGTSEHTSTTSTPIKPHKAPATHLSTAFNPLTDRIETHTTQNWQQIRAEHAKQVHDATAAKKKYDAWLAQTVTDMLKVGGMAAGEIQLTRKQADREGLPAGHPLQLASIGPNMSLAGFKKVQAGLAAQLATDSLTETLALSQHLIAQIARKHLGPHSRPDQLENRVIAAALKGIGGEFANQQKQFQHSATVAGLLEKAPPGSTAASLGLSPTQLRAIGMSRADVKRLAGADSGPAGFLEQMKDLSTKQIPQYQRDARQLQQQYKDALKTHNKKLQHALLTQLDAVTQAQIQASTDLQTAQIGLVDSIYQQAQTKTAGLQSSSDLITAIQGLPQGTNLGAIGLTPGVLARLGLGGQNLTGLTGGGNPMAAAQLSNSFLAQQRRADAGALEDLLKQLPTLKGSALDSANQHVQDLSKSIASLTTEINTNLMNAIKSAAQGFQDQADAAGGGVSLLSAIGDLPPGTNLSRLGFSAPLLGMLGINPASAAGIAGYGPGAISNDLAAQNNTLTPAQLAGAKDYYGTINAGIQKELGGPTSGLIGELNYDFMHLGDLTGSDRTGMLSTIRNLAGTIAGLEKSIHDNTAAMDKLTSATNANTTATGQLTGTVAYTYNGQDFLGSLSSDRGANLGVGG